MKKNLLITVEYDGTGFSGWQRQPGMRTVQGELERVLSILCRQEIQIDGTGRTDAGVHALGQCATFSGDFGIPEDRLMTAANDILAESRLKGGDVRITSVRCVPEDFHARFSAKGKRYIYKIFNGDDMPVFLRNYRYCIRKPLDVDAMASALEAFRGTHDFAGFMAAGSNLKGSTVRTIFDVDLSVREAFQPSADREALQPSGDREVDSPSADREAAQTDAAGSDGRDIAREIEIAVAGNGFLYNMVRIIAGTLVDVGLGKISAKDIPEIIASCDRSSAGHTAPPQGLYMAEVFF